jgi:hypothetical protein
MTNADKIRSMTDEELVGLLLSVEKIGMDWCKNYCEYRGSDGVCSEVHEHDRCPYIKDEDMLKAWLLRTE